MQFRPTFFLLIDLWENFEIVISQGNKIKVKKKLWSIKQKYLLTKNTGKIDIFYCKNMAGRQIHIKKSNSNFFMEGLLKS